MLKHPLAREIGVALVIKLVALIVIYLAFFGPAHRTRVTPSDMLHALFESSAADAR